MHAIPTLCAIGIFDDPDIDALAAEFSERVPRSPFLRPAMDELVGNRWEDAEAVIAGFLRATLFLDKRPEVDGDWLARSVRTLNGEAIDLLADILLNCALVAVPLHSAAVFAEISEQLARLLKSVVSQDGVAWRGRGSCSGRARGYWPRR